MSRRCLSRKVIADRQRRNARIVEWRSISPEQQNLIIRRLSTRRDVLRANRNAKSIETQATSYTEAEVSEMMQAAEPVEEAV